MVDGECVYGAPTKFDSIESCTHQAIDTLYNLVFQFYMLIFTIAFGKCKGTIMSVCLCVMDVPIIIL